jgi:hypothetical protein
VYTYIQYKGQWEVVKKFREWDFLRWPEYDFPRLFSNDFFAFGKIDGGAKTRGIEKKNPKESKEF